MLSFSWNNDIIGKIFLFSLTIIHQMNFFFVHMSVITKLKNSKGKSPCGVEANMLDCNIVASVAFTFVLILFKKVWIPLYPLSYGLNSTTTVLELWLWH